MKRDARTLGAVRLVQRLAGAAMIVAIVVLVAIQFGRMIQDNLATSRELASVRTDIHALQERKRSQLREIRRLRTPEGAVPEIHERLGLVRPNEALVFVKPALPSPSPNP